MKYLLAFLVSLSLTSAQDKAAVNVAKANNLFAPRLYQQLNQIENGNFLSSPFSAEVVLALLQSGTEGPTGDELRKGLQLPNNKTEVESGYKSLLPQLKGNDQYTFLTANKIYVRINFAIKDRFKNVAKQVYYSEAENIDFSKTNEAAGKINNWVEGQTNNKIQNLLSPDALDAGTAVVLVNALYFKGNWSNQFFETNTKKGNFYVTENKVVQVDIMHHFGITFNYYECGYLRAQFLELKFQGGEASMVIVLPRARNGLSNFEKDLGHVITTDINFKPQNLNVALPKFKIETTIDFKNVLQKLGVQKIFSPNDADLSGISGQKGDLYVNLVTQKTFISVNEGGVEAAAATAVGVVPTSLVLNPKEFNADHPFLFWIKVKNVIVFVGKVTDPSR